MDNFLWAKTILSSYTKLPMAIKTIDKSVNAIAKGFFGRSCGDNQYDKLINVIKRKKSMEYAIEIVKDIMRKIGKDNVDILYFKYVKDMAFQEIALLKNLNLRTVFRRHDSQLNSFVCEMNQRGLNEQFCENEWGKDILFRQYSQKVMDNKLSYNKTGNFTAKADIANLNKINTKTKYILEYNNLEPQIAVPLKKNYYEYYNNIE